MYMKLSKFSFAIIGGINGAFLSLIPAYLLDLFCKDVPKISSISYVEWLLMLTPLFFALGIIINMCATLIIADEEEAPKKKRSSKKTK